MNPMKDVVFTWKNGAGRTESIKTKYAYAREIAIDLLEKISVDEVIEVYYTVDGITHKLDYYNTVL